MSNEATSSGPQRTSGGTHEPAPKRRLHVRRRRLLAGASLVVLVGMAIWGGLAVASPSGVPGPIVGLVSPTHPVEATWYGSNDPTFAWNPTTASDSAIAGYSIALDQNPATVPDTVTDRKSLDFLPRASFPVGSSPTEDRVADFNGDGKLDLVVENAGSNTVSVLTGNGDGTLRPKVDYATGTQPWSMDVGDVNGDGRPDIVVANHTANTASVLINNGDGTFKAKVDYATGNTPESLKLGDVNDDGKLDILTSNATASSVSVLLGNGDGTFRPESYFTAGAHPTSIDTGDVNGDGKLDIVTANYDAGSVSVLTGNGDGTFNTNVDYGTGSGPETVVVADVNKDGKPDIATVNGPGSSASILVNKGDGTFKSKVDYATGAMPYALDVLDLNQDGAVDLVTTNHNSNTVSVLFGNGDGTFNARTDRATGTGPFWVALGDFNGDGYGDLAVTDGNAGTASILLGTAFLAASYTGKADGVWYFHVRAVDSYGDGGATSTRVVRIDTTAPTTTQSGADALWHNTDVNVTFSASDAGSGVAKTEYRVDGAGWVSGTEVTVPAPSDGSNDGVHTVRYCSTDALGHVETAKSCAVKIVTVAPTTSVSGADSAWHDSAVPLTFSSGSAGDPVTEYRVDGAGWVNGTEVTVPASHNGSNDGTHTVEYRSVNALGMTEGAKSATVKIDVGAPTTSVSGADSLWHDDDVTLDFSASDAGSGVAKTEYRVDGDDWVELTGGSLVVPAPPDGSNDRAHTVEYRSTDALGHVEDAKSATVKIDGGAPTTTQSGADALWHDADVSVTFSGSDAGSGVVSTEYRIDSGDWVSGTEVTVPAPSDGSNDGTHTIEYRSTDAFGHVENAKSATVKIDAAAPTTSVSGADSLWHDGDMTLDFSASDAGGGVAKTEYRVDGGDWVELTGGSLVVPAPADGSNDGIHTVEYRSTDALGHVEDAKSCDVKIGHLNVFARYIRHKLSLIIISWKAVPGAATYDVVVEGATVGCTTDSSYRYLVPAAAKNRVFTLEIAARDAGGTQLWTSGAEVPWRM